MARPCNKPILCPECGKANLEIRKERFVYKGKDFGRFDAYVCPNCQQPYFREKSCSKIQPMLKKFLGK